MEQPQEPAKKKEYQPPALERYGDLVEVTQNLGSGTHMDHSVAHTKT
jgi:hypothetical protein